MRRIEEWALLSAALGIAIGLVAAFALSRFVAATLFELTATDPLTFGLVVGFLFGVAPLAAWLTARRAVRVEPIEALRVG